MSELDRYFAPDVVDAIEALVEERVARELAALHLRDDRPEWLTLVQAADLLGCTPDAVRMRAKRGRLVTRTQGRRLYVSAESVRALS